jgi:hypothetical protein
MNLLKTIIERLNQRIEVANIFDKQFSLCELNANGNDKAWVHYIGNGQAEVVTNFDAKNGTLFWAKRSKVTVNKTDAYKMSGCKQLYVTTFPLTAYAIVRKSHLPCDSEDAQDWLASRIYKLASGTDPLFKQSIGVINYEVVPTGYINEIKTLTANYEWACVSVDMDVQVITSSEDGCYDTCATGDIPLPDLQPCTPCLTEVAVDGVTITGNGTEADPLVAVGGGGGNPLTTQDEGSNVSTNTTTLNFTGDGVTATLTSPGVVEVNIPSGGGGVGSLQDVTDVGNSTTNDIDFIANAGLTFDNGALFRKGTTDAGNGGAKGTAQICSISYELKLEAGRLYYMEQDGFTIRDVTHNFTFVPQPTDDSTKGFVVGSRWSLDDGTVYLCSDATIGAAVWAVVSTGGVTSVTATSPIFSSGGTTPDISIQPANLFDDGYLTSADFTSFSNKFDVPTGTNTDYLDGTGTPTPFPTIPSGTVTSVNSGININVDNTNPAAPIINSLSDRYKTSSTTSNSVTNGSKSFTVDLNLSYIPLQEILVVFDPAHHMHGEVTSYNPETGALVVDIKTHTGSGTYSSWVINLDGTPVDALTGSGTANEVAYFTASRVLASLPVATYPSLTELSYVKGVTSAIQTQINSKFNTPAGTTSQYVRGDGSLAAFPNVPAFLPYITEVMSSSTATNNSIEYVASVNKIYVTNGSNNVNIFNATTGELLATVTLTQALRARYINSINEVWVTSVNVASITRINPSTNAVIGTITTSIVANGFDICEISSTKVYVSINGSGGAQRVQVINPSTLAFVADITASIPGFCSGMAFNNNPSSAQNGVVILGSSGGAVTLIDSATNTVTVATTNPGSALSNVFEIMYSAVDDKYYVSSQANSRVVSLNITGATTLTLDKIKYNAIANISLQIDDANDLLIINQIASTPTPNVMCHFIRKSTFESLYNIMTPAQGGANTRAGFVRADLVNKRVFLAGRSASSTAVVTVKY